MQPRQASFSILRKTAGNSGFLLTERHFATSSTISETPCKAEEAKERRIVSAFRKPSVSGVVVGGDMIAPILTVISLGIKSVIRDAIIVSAKIAIEIAEPPIITIAIAAIAGQASNNGNRPNAEQIPEAMPKNANKIAVSGLPPDNKTIPAAATEQTPAAAVLPYFAARIIRVTESIRPSDTEANSIGKSEQRTRFTEIKRQADCSAESPESSRYLKAKVCLKKNAPAAAIEPSAKTKSTSAGYAVAIEASQTPAVAAPEITAAQIGLLATELIVLIKILIATIAKSAAMYLKPEMPLERGKIYPISAPKAAEGKKGIGTPPVNAAPNG